VVEDHLRFALLMTFGHLSEIEQAAGVEQRIDIAVEAARIPGQVDQQAVEDLLGVGSGRRRLNLRPADVG
jgi:hypothetical protein